MRVCLKIILSLVLGLSILSSFFLQNQKVSAATDHLVINEVYYDAVKEPDEEWIEIYNPTDIAVDLTGYKIGDEETKGGDEGMYYLPQGTDIGPRMSLVIANSRIAFSDLYKLEPNLAIKELIKYTLWATGSLGLSNTGDEILLLDNSDQVVDVVVYGNGIYPGIIPCLKVSEGHSFERQPKGKDTDDCAKDFVDQPSPFPNVPAKATLSLSSNLGGGEIDLVWSKNEDSDFRDYILYQSKNNQSWIELETISQVDKTTLIVDSLTPGDEYYFKIRVENQKTGFIDSDILHCLVKKIYSQAVIINELFPHPSTGADDEFIELYNSSGEDIDLSSWILDDSEDKGTPYIIPNGPNSIIEAHSYLIFYNRETKLSLNDDGDQARLFWPDGGICSQSEIYPSVESKKDISWSRNLDGSWVFSTTATPSAENIITIKEEKKDTPAESQDLQIISINDAKNQPKNSYVKVVGIVTAIPGLFGKKVMYLQDESGGIKIYFDDALWPELKIGDQVIIIGKISTSSGEYQVKVYNASDIIIIGGLPPPEPVEFKINQLADLVGSLVKISGRVTKISGSSVWLSDGTGTLRFYYYSTTGIKGLGLDEGDWVEVIGILSKTSSGLRILPRSMDDLKIKKVKEQTATQSESIIDKVLGVEKAKAASADYRSTQEIASVQKKYSYFWGISIIILGFISLATLMIFARIREKYAKDNQFF